MTDTAYSSIEGRRFGIGPKGNLGFFNAAGVFIPFGAQAVDAAITVSAENTNVRTIAVQLKNANGDNVNERQALEVVVLLDANGDAFVTTGGSTGIADGGAGTILATVAKKMFKAITNNAGLLELTWTDTGTEAAYLGVILPSGRMVISSALTNT